MPDRERSYLGVDLIARAKGIVVVAEKRLKEFFHTEIKGKSADFSKDLLFALYKTLPGFVRNLPNEMVEKNDLNSE